MSQLERVQELNRMKSLDCDLAHLTNLKALVAVILDEIVETLAEWLENEAHIAHVTIALPRLVSESLFQVDNTSLTATLS